MASFYSMPTIVEVIDTFIKPHYKKILIVVALIVFSVSAYYIYNKWNQPVADKYKDIYQPNDDGANEATVYFFFADWCPHCTKAKPEWTAFANEKDGKIVNGTKLRCIMVDCSDPDVSDVAAKIDQYGVNSYPTIKLVFKDNTYDFDASVTKEHLDKFVETIIV
jgi:thiol-disulfide isomerase/thioredoxin